MVILLTVIAALAAICIWLLFRARKAERLARSETDRADTMFEMFTRAAAKRDRLQLEVEWLRLGEEMRKRRLVS